MEQNIIEDAARISTELGLEYHPYCHLEAYLIALHLAGEMDIDYETLATISGVATTFCYHLTSYTGCYVFLPGEDDRIAGATGYRFERTWAGDTPEKAWELIKETIDDGTVLQAEAIERMVYAGYQEAERKEARKALAIGGLFPSKGKWMSWEEFENLRRESDPSVSRIVEKVQKADPATLAKEVLKNIADWSYSDPRVKNEWLMGISERIGRGGFKWGIAGIEAFAADLDDITLKSDDFSSGWRHCHIILMQSGARKAASIWLERLARKGILKESATVHLITAAKKYRMAYMSWQEFGSFDWDIKESRAKMANAVRQAAIHEQEAIVAVKEVLMAIS